jgi:hypothetical protein
MAGFSNRGKYRMLQYFVGGDSGNVTGEAAQFYCALATNSVGPPAGTIDHFGDLDQSVTGFGYPDGGIVVDRTATQWATTSEDDGSNFAYVRSADITFTNTGGGTIPGSGGAYYAVLTDDLADPITGREVIGWGSFGGSKTSGTDQDFVVQNLEMRLTE